jgi:DNA-directed RNA polymerase subunit beta'
VEAGEVIEPLRDRIVGRVTLEDVQDPITGDAILEANQEITEDYANIIQDAGISRVKIRSVLTCESKRGVCAKCYGRDLATAKLVEIGEAVGVIGAQSIGEPGTQLTMRTFHFGGAQSRAAERSTLAAKNAGKVKFINLSTVKSKTGDLVVMNRNGYIANQDHKGREMERYSVVYGARLKVVDNQAVEIGAVLVEWDPYTFSILTEVSGVAQFKDVIEGETMKEEVDEITGFARQIIMEFADEKRQPQVAIRSKDGKLSKKYLLPSGAHLVIPNHAEVFQGDTIAKIPRETTKAKDITGGLPRVVDLFEARRPKEPAVITEIDGLVKYGGIVKGMRKIAVVNDSGESRPHQRSGE